MRYDGSGTYDSNPPALYDSIDLPGLRKQRMKVRNPVPGLPESERTPKAQDIHDHMAGNAHFPTTIPTMAVFQTHITNAETKFAAAVAAITAARTAVQAKRAAFDLMESDTSQLATDVENVANGDEEIILGAGFEVRAPSSPLGILPAPTGLVAVAGEFTGQLIATWDPVSGVKLYEVQNSSDPNLETGWATRGTTSKASIELNGLPRGGYCWVRVRAIGTAGPGPWSGAAAKTVP